MKLVILISVISVIMIAVLTAIYILDERYKRKRIAEIEEKLKGRYRK